MCGISCILSLANTSQPNSERLANGTHGDAAAASKPKREHLKEELHASLEQIRHRGPDGTGDWISDDCRVGTLAPSPLQSFRTYDSRTNASFQNQGLAMFASRSTT